MDDIEILTAIKSNSADLKDSLKLTTERCFYAS